jgi:hypothetical protein
MCYASVRSGIPCFAACTPHSECSLDPIESLQYHHLPVTQIAILSSQLSPNTIVVVPETDALSLHMRWRAARRPTFHISTTPQPL